MKPDNGFVTDKFTKILEEGSSHGGPNATGSSSSAASVVTPTRHQARHRSRHDYSEQPPPRSVQEDRAWMSNALQSCLRHATEVVENASVGPAPPPSTDVPDRNNTQNPRHQEPPPPSANPPADPPPCVTSPPLATYPAVVDNIVIFGLDSPQTTGPRSAAGLASLRQPLFSKLCMSSWSTSLSDDIPDIDEDDEVSPAEDGLQSIMTQVSQLSTQKKRRQMLGFMAPFDACNMLLEDIRRRSRSFTLAEDKAMYEGYKRYGCIWVAYPSDPSLGLRHRSPLQVRSRFRSRWPESYRLDEGPTEPLVATEKQVLNAERMEEYQQYIQKKVQQGSVILGSHGRYHPPSAVDWQEISAAIAQITEAPHYSPWESAPTPTSLAAAQDRAYYRPPATSTPASQPPPPPSPLSQPLQVQNINGPPPPPPPRPQDPDLAPPSHIPSPPTDEDPRTSPLRESRTAIDLPMRSHIPSPPGTASNYGFGPGPYILSTIRTRVLTPPMSPESLSNPPPVLPIGVNRSPLPPDWVQQIPRPPPSYRGTENNLNSNPNSNSNLNLNIEQESGSIRSRRRRNGQAREKRKQARRESDAAAPRPRERRMSIDQSNRDVAIGGRESVPMEVEWPAEREANRWRSINEVLGQNKEKRTDDGTEEMQ